MFFKTFIKNIKNVFYIYGSSSSIIITVNALDAWQLDGRPHIMSAPTSFLVNLFYRLVSFPNWTVHLLTRHSWLKTGFPPTAVNL